MKRLILTCIAALATAGAAIAANWSIRDIDVHVLLHRDGSASVREIWDMSADEGTEVYVPRENLGDIVISGFTVSDESGQRYVTEDFWDTERSLKQKAGRCGINGTRNGVELCWGLGSYGKHTYSIEYEMSNVVKSLNDYDMLHMQLVNDQMAASPKHVKVVIEAEDRQLDTTWVRMWGFGYEGTAVFSNDGTVVYESEKPFRSSSSVIALLRMEKGVFASNSVQARDFQSVLDRAMDGADFGDDDESLLDVLAGLFSMLLFLAPVLAIFASGSMSRRKRRKLLGCSPDKVAWYRDLPFDGDIYETDYMLDLFVAKRQPNAIASALILRMLQKGYLTVRKDAKGKIEIMFADDKDISLLDEHERRLYEMMEKASGADHILQNLEFSRWSSRTTNQNSIRTWALKMSAYAKSKVRSAGLIQRAKVTEAGAVEARKVFGFKNYLRDYTLVNERESVEVSLWQDYLVYAALFGIAKEVAKELRDINPQVFDEVMPYDYVTMHNVIYMTDTLSKSITNARISSSASAGGYGGHSSFGGGGGFSGGGHGGGVR